MTSPTAESPLVNLTEAGLMKLLNDVAKGQGYLPPGAYRDESGTVYRDVWEPTGRLRKNKQTGQTEAVNRKIRRPVYLTYDMSPEGLVAGRKAAAKRGLDFYWSGPPLDGAPGLPRGDTKVIGWLRNGTKREVDVPSNCGTGAQAFEMQYVPVEREDDEEGTSATMQGVAAEPDAAPESAPLGDVDTRDAFSDDAVREAAAASSGRRARSGG
jgi:hypothetical protein